MFATKTPTNEEVSLNSLMKYYQIDNEQVDELNDITYIASVLCNAPICIISLLIENRQFSNSQQGVEIAKSKLFQALCDKALHQVKNDFFILPNEQLPSYFDNNSSQIEEFAIIFFACYSLLDKDGMMLGTLSIIDSQPHTLTFQQQEGLKKLSTQAQRIVTQSKSSKFDEHVKLMSYAFKNSVIPTILVQPDASFYEVNESFCKLLGYSWNELQSMKVQDIDFNPDYCQEKWEAHWNLLKTNHQFNVETTFRKKNGDLVYVLIKTDIIDIEGQELNCAFVIDLTEKKQLQQRLDLLEFSFRNIATPIHIINKDASLYDFNEAAYKLLGYTKEEYKDVSIADIDLDYGLDIWPRHWEELKNAKTLKFETTLKRKDGTIIYVNISANYIQYDNQEFNYTFITDITESKRVAEQMQLYDFAIKNATWGMLFIKEDGSFYNYNKAFAAIYGYDTLEEMADKTIFDFGTGFTEQSWKLYWQGLKDKTISNFVAKRQKKDGTIIDVSINPNYIKFGDLELNCVFVFDVTEKALFQHKLNEQRTFYEDILNQIPAEIAVFDTDFRYLFVNPSAVKDEAVRQWIIGKDDDEYVAHSNKSLNIAKGRKAVYHDVSNSKRLISWEEELIGKNGKHEFIYRSIFPVLNNAGDIRMLIGYAVNVTALHEANDKRNLFEFGFRNIGTATMMVDEDGLIYDFNDACFKLLGYTKEEFKNLRISQIDVLQTKAERAKFRDEFRVTKSITQYKKLRRKDGTWVDIEGKFEYLLYKGVELNYVFMTDITEKKQIEDRFKLVDFSFRHGTTAKQFFRKDGTVHDFNEAACKLLGYTPEEYQHLSIFDISNKLTKDSWAVRWEELKTEDMNVKTTQLRRKDQTLIDVEINSCILHYPDFDISFSSIIDITEKRKAEKEKEKLLQELIINNSELSQFSYIVSHNLRAPLTNLVSIANLIKTNNIEDKKTVHLIEGFKTSTKLLNETLNDLIKVMVIKENKNWAKEVVDIAQVFNKIKILIANKLEDAHALIVEDFSDAPRVVFSKEYLESILINLLTNSLRYAHSERAPIIHIKSTSTPSGGVKLEFTDNGIGMKMSRVKDKIFGLYQRFHNNSDGKGLGLYLIHSQVTALGGSISVQSEENVGTTFEIVFK